MLLRITRKKKTDWDAPLRSKRIKEQKCVVKDCSSPSSHNNGYCRKHYRRWKAHGNPLTVKINEKGKGHKTEHGYIKIYDKKLGRAVAEQRLVMAKIIGRDLFPDETVHHINGIRHDNRPPNLELWTRSHPSGQRVADVVKWAKEILKRYEV